MIQPILHHTKNLVISALAISLAACSSGGESTTSSPSVESPNSQTLSASSPSPQQTDLQASVSIPGVNSVKEIKFQGRNLSDGFFDKVNNSSALTHEVSRAAPIQVSGWAFVSGERKPADVVLITYGDNNTLVATAPVNLDRPDVAKALKNPAYKNSGWNATFNASTLPTGKVALKAWVYNSARKQATQLGNIHEVIVK